MRRYRWFVLLLTVAVSLSSAGGLSAALLQEGYLTVDNRTRGAVDVSVWRHDGQNWGWVYLGTVNPGTPQEFWVQQGEQFRAWLHSIQQERFLVANLSRDSQSGLYRTQWIIYE